MKKLVALVLSLVLCLSCLPAMAEDTLDLSKVKLGVILLHDEKSTYDKNFIDGVNEAVAALGLSEDQVIMVRNIDES